jgi:DeoR/GlpR family transcriptional regulator of sugar metabolism
MTFRPKRDGWFQHQRLMWIDCQLSLYGKIRRRDIMGYFGVSKNTAVYDLAIYQALGGRIKLCGGYVPAEDFRPVYKGNPNDKHKAFKILEKA